ncbi:CRA-b-like protein [Coleophoma crateriformis]|uniref:CRA-b-like protein n=1 Tax=Coleophoma crateriformis TaxID=565419 RepID=A0A3D8S946_9HELO|nr:CRA-b-like protein [Coleophoma crateriformis]
MANFPTAYDNLERFTDDLCDFIATPLIRQLTGGIHVNDALIHNSWETLPQEWTRWWSLISDHRLAQQDLINAIDEDAEPRSKGHGEQAQLSQSRPESLTEWLSTMKSLAISRTRCPGPTITLPEVLIARMKTKKISEVSIAAAYIQGVCQSRGITHIIDMGSGQGYLSISLAYLFPNLQILAIDSSKSQVAGSQLFATSLGIPESRLKHIVHLIDGSLGLSAIINNWADGQKCMLVGLHACGSLSEHILRYFTSVICIEALAVVGCCYNHIVPRSPSCPTGFPISSALREKGVMLSATALMTACQAPNNWGTLDKDRSRDKEKSDFGKRRLYRAIMEKILFDKGIKMNSRQKAFWGIRKGDLVHFTKFARRAMDCLEIDYDKITTVELLYYERKYQDYKSQIAILWTLSVLCCKVIESVIALDRYFYLVEQKADNVDIIPIFDFKISPRNLMVVAEKVVYKSQ